MKVPKLICVPFFNVFFVWSMLHFSRPVASQFHEQRLLLSALTAANQSIESLESSQQLLACDSNKQRQQFIRYAGLRVQPMLMEHWSLHGLQSVRISLHSNQSVAPDSSPVWTVQQCITACASDPHCHSFVFHPIDACCYLLPLSTGLLLRSHLLDQNTIHKGDSHYFEKLCLTKGIYLLARHSRRTRIAFFIIQHIELTLQAFFE